MTFEEILKIVLQVQGEQDARALASAIADAGKKAGLSDDQLAGFVTEIEKIGRAKEAIKTIEALSAEQTDLAATTDRLGLRLKLATEAQQSASDAARQAATDVQAAKQAQDAYAASQDKTAEGTSRYAQAVKDATAAQKAAKAELSAADALLKSTSREYERAADAQSNNAKESVRLTGVLKEAGVATLGLADAQEELDSRAGAAQAALSDLAENAKLGAETGAELSKTLDDLAKEEARLAKEAKAAAKEVERQGDSTAKAGKAATSFGERIKSAREAIGGFASGLLRITGIAGAVSAALGALSLGRLFGSAIASARTFESVLSEVQAVSGATTEQLSRMRDASEAASATTKFTAQEAASALGELARASGDADAAIAQLPPTLNLAQAAGLEASRSAEILTTALTQFGLEATEAARVADLFAREANSTQDTVEKLGLAMSYVAPLARQFGMSVEDATALLGAMAEQGFRGERAGTALRNVFSALLDPASKFSRALRTLGIDGDDFIGVISQLAAAGDEGRKAILALDAEARPAILALVKSGGEGIRRLQEDFKSAAGEAERTAQAIGANFEGASNRFTSALDFLRRSLVDPILEPLAKEFDDAARRIRAFVETADFKALAASIRDFAVGSARAIAEFVRGIDFGFVLEKIRAVVDATTSLVDSTNSKVGELTGSLRRAGSLLQIFWNGAQTVILGAATIASRGVQLFANSILFMSKAVAQATGTLPALQGYFAEMEVRVAALGAVADEFSRQTKDNASETAEAFKALTEAVSGAASAADRASPSLDRSADTLRRTDAAAAGAASQLEAYGDAASFAAKTTRESEQAFIAQQQSLIAARASVQALKDQLLELVKSGKGSADEMQRLQSAITRAEAEVRKLSSSQKDAAASAKQLEGAFAQLGLQTQKDLTNLAATSRASFETIVAAYQSGGAAIEDVVRAFAAYAEAERNAADVSSASGQQRVESMLSAKAAALGLTTELERAGVIGRQAGEDTAASMRDAKEAIDGVADAASNMAASQVEARQEAQQVNNTIITMTLLTEAQQQALKQLGQDWRAGRLDAQAYAEAVTRAMADSTDSIEEQIEATERATEALREMRAELQDEADRAAGNEVDIENRRYQEQLQRIRDLEEQGGAAARREAAEVRRLADEEHRRRLEEIRAEARARRDAEREEAAQTPRPSSGGGSNSGGGSGGGGSTAPQPANIIFNIDGGVFQDIDVFTREVERRMQDIWRRRR